MEILIIKVGGLYLRHAPRRPERNRPRTRMRMRRKQCAGGKRAEIVAVLPAVLWNNHFAVDFFCLVLAARLTKQRFNFLLGHARVNLAPIILILGFTTLQAQQRQHDCERNDAFTRANFARQKCPSTRERWMRCIHLKIVTFGIALI